MDHVCNLYVLLLLLQSSVYQEILVVKMYQVACFYREKCKAHIPAGVGGSIR
uniref:Uncharacterized protein n=1 Tax=Triticum urartu TaxID=4572 RepID=A0A8R7TZI1_TRIUA